MSGEIPAVAAAPAFSEAVKTWLRIGLTSFGGPAGQIALMHRLLVEEKKWIDDKTYLTALNFCTLLPGPEAMQLATYSGWRLHGIKGGLAAGLLFVLPGALLMLALSAIYAAYGAVPAMTAIFTGIKACVLAIVVEALLKVSRRSLANRAEWGIAGLAFLAIFLLQVPFPLIIAVAAGYGYLSGPRAVTGVQSLPLPRPLAETARTVGVWLAIWLVPLGAIVIMFGSDHVLSQLAWFFSKLAIVTFGGAYAVLAYMAQAAVQSFGWLKPGEMLDGLGLAETTPGPLILVTQFVGFLAAYRAGGDSFALGFAGALLTLWATFAPCFLYIFAGAPYVEWLKSAPRLKSALSAITAAVVGVILNLSVWFALHVIFDRVRDTSVGVFHLPLPDVQSLNVTAAVLTAASAILLLRLKWNMILVLALSGAASYAASLPF